MKERGMIYRRNQINRIKEKRKYYWGCGVPHSQVRNITFLGLGKGWIKEHVRREGVTVLTGRWLGIVSKTPKQITAYKHFEKRKYIGMTRKEKMQHIGADEQLIDLVME